MRRDLQPEESNMETPSNTLVRQVWIGTMATTSTIASLLLACATPFPSLAALAASQVSRRDGMALMFVAWFAAQAVTIMTHGFTMELSSLVWPLALGTAAGASLLAAEMAGRSLGGAHPMVRTGVGYVGAFLGFKLGILLWVSMLDHGWAAFSADVLLRQFVRNGAILVGFIALQALLARAGFRIASLSGSRAQAA